MNVGLPGTGLAGLFYLLAALWMPCRELGRTWRGERDAARWRLALTQASLALAIIAAIAASAWLVGLPLAAHLAPATVPDGGAGGAGDAAPGAWRFLGVAPGAAAFVTLAVIVALLEALGLILACRRRGT